MKQKVVGVILLGFAILTFGVNMFIDTPGLLELGYGFFIGGLAVSLVPSDTKEEPEEKEDYQKIFEELEEMEKNLGIELDTEQKINIMMNHLQHIEEKMED